MQKEELIQKNAPSQGVASGQQKPDVKNLNPKNVQEELNKVISSIKSRGTTKSFVTGQALNDLKTDLVKKKEKENRLKELGFIGRKRRNKPIPSEKQTLLNTLYKNKVSSIEQVRGFINNAGYKANDDQVKHYFELASMNIHLYNMKLLRPLITSPMTIVLESPLHGTFTYLTTDLLFWADKVHVAMDKSQDKNFLQCTELSKVFVYSERAIVHNKPKLELEEFYIQDFSTQLSFPNVKVGDIPEQYMSDWKSFLTVHRLFSIYGKIYHFRGTPDEKYGIFWDDSDKNLDSSKKIYEYIKNSVRIKKEKGELKKGIKEFNKTSKAFYFQDWIRPTTFCPSVIQLPSYAYVQAKTFFYMKLDPEEFMNFLNRTNQLTFPLSSITPENTHSFCELLRVALITVPALKDYEYYRNLIELYFLNVEIFKKIREHYIQFKKIILMFYDSFSSRIMIDRLLKISELCTKYLDDDDVLRASSVELESAKAFYSKMDEKIVSLTNNYFKNFTSQLVLLIKYVISELCVKNANTEQLEPLVRTTGWAIYSCFYGNASQCIPETRSPCAFFGNLTGEYSAEYINQKLNSLFQKVYSRTISLEKGDSALKTDVAVLLREQKKKLTEKFVDAFNKMQENNYRKDFIQNQVYNLLTSDRDFADVGLGPNIENKMDMDDDIQVQDDNDNEITNVEKNKNQGGRRELPGNVPSGSTSANQSLMNK